MISKLNKQQIFLGRPGLPLSRLKPGRRVYNPHNLRPKFLAGRVSTGLSDSPDQISEFLDKMSLSSWYDGWGFFPWVYDKAAQVTSWALTKVGMLISIPGKSTNICLHFEQGML